jgi:prepilin-type N-terminal cleavage/methylation domain-containing protein
MRKSKKIFQNTFFLVEIMSTRIQSTKNNSIGFTLIELLVVIAMLAVLGLIAIPAFSAWMPEYRLKQAARELYSNLQRAKMGAVKANESWGVWFDNSVTPGRYLICSLGANGQWDVSDPNDDPRKITINLSDYKGVNYGRALSIPKIDPGDLGSGSISYQTPSQVVVFTNRGTVGNPFGFVYLSNGKGTCYAVGTPSPAGVVVLRKWNGSTWQ